MKRLVRVAIVWVLVCLAVSAVTAEAKQTPKHPTFSMQVLGRAGVWRGAKKSLETRELDDAELVWSPDGKWAAYTLKEERISRTDWARFSLCYVRRDGKVVKRLKTWGVMRYAPEIAMWSPDSRRLLYWTTVAQTDSGAAELYDIGIPSGRRRLLSPPSRTIRDKTGDALFSGEQVSFSPDGKSIVFGPKRMVKVDYATTKAQWLTPVKADVWESLWPPDGKRIAYIACDDKMSRVAIPKYMDEITARIGRQRLWVMNADGTHKLQLTNDTNYHESTPRWSGNSAEIQFERTTNPTMNQMRSLWAIGAEGKGLHWLKDLPPLE